MRRLQSRLPFARFLDRVVSRDRDGHWEEEEEDAKVAAEARGLWNSRAGCP